MGDQHHINTSIELKIGELLKNIVIPRTFIRTINFGMVKILERDGDIYTIEFTRTGYTRQCQVTHLFKGKVKDYLQPTVCNIGCLGIEFNNIKSNYSKLYKKVRHTWKAMLSRCYDMNNPNWIRYGKVGVYVENDWLNFSNFFYDFIKLPGFIESDYLSGKLSLDKDKLSTGYKVYSKSTCSLLTRQEQNNYIDRSHNIKRFSVVYPDGTIHNIENITQFANTNGLCRKRIATCINGPNHLYSGYKFYNKLIDE